MKRKALLVVGSPKPGAGSSESIGDYLLGQLELKGMKTEKIKINRALKSEDGIAALVSAVDNCDYLVFSCPLYVDSAPASVVKAMEIIAEARRGKERAKEQVMLAICNSGFPEASQNHTALAIYRLFAREAGFAWAGGLALGGGGAIGGKPLAGRGGMVRNIIKSLDLTAAALVEGKPVPKEALSLMAKPMVAGWLYLLVGNFMWKGWARKNGAHKKLKDRPYQL
jgi:multimeric flavodoxin WrbA